MTLLLRDLAPDLVLHNGRIVTLNEALPRCSALAAKDGRVVALGDDADVRALAGPATQVIDLQGRTAIPGINDAHNHLLQVGLKFGRLALEECQSIAEMVDLVRRAAATTPPGQWIIGEGWSESHFAEGRLPHRGDLDAATTDHPVVLMRFFNMDVANSAALVLAGVDTATPNPPRGTIERFPDGSPSGILRASAKELVRARLPQPTLAEMVTAIEAAGRAYLAYGITSILDPGLEPEEIRAYIQAHRQARLPLRVNLMPSWHGFHDGTSEETLDARAAALGVASGLGDEWLRLGALKMAVDGGTTSHTAWMFHPFVGETEVKDYNRLDPADLQSYFARGHDLGWDIGIHAIGDRAHHEVAAAFAAVLRDRDGDARHQMIHAYFATPESLDHMARHRLAAVIQPTFIYYEGDDLFRDVGAELAHRYKPMRTYLDDGIRVVATSDMPSTVHYNPFPGLYALVARKTIKGTPIAPQEAVSREEALRAYTVAGAWLTREESIKGPLAPGYLADVAVLDRDYFSVPEEEIKDVQVDMTIIGGRVVYQRSA